MSEKSFKPALGLWDATMIVAGSMIGSGIFIVSADILRNVGGPGWLLVVWGITGFMTITAAVSYGELSGMYPKAGGQYVYLKEAFSPLNSSSKNFSSAMRRSARRCPFASVSGRSLEFRISVPKARHSRQRGTKRAASSRCWSVLANRS